MAFLNQPKLLLYVALRITSGSPLRPNISPTVLWWPLLDSLSVHLLPGHIERVCGSRHVTHHTLCLRFQVRLDHDAHPPDTVAVQRPIIHAKTVGFGMAQFMRQDIVQIVIEAVFGYLDGRHRPRIETSPDGTVWKIKGLTNYDVWHGTQQAWKPLLRDLPCPIHHPNDPPAIGTGWHAGQHQNNRE